jgi:tRNA(Ser,Leu) C12 N-acetylase TAN1
MDNDTASFTREPAASGLLAVGPAPAPAATAWNVLVALRGKRISPALRLLSAYGRVHRTGFYNVVALRVDDLAIFLERLRADWLAFRDVHDRLAHVFPAHAACEFADADELVRRAMEIALAWLPRLAGKGFHVRMHRRGLERVVSSQEVERRLGGALLDELARRGDPARIRFADADQVIDLETIGRRAYLAIWSREELARYPFLRIG